LFIFCFKHPFFVVLPEITKQMAFAKTQSLTASSKPLACNADSQKIQWSMLRELEDKVSKLVHPEDELEDGLLDDTKSDVMDDRPGLPPHYIIDYSSIRKRSDDSMGTLPLLPDEPMQRENDDDKKKMVKVPKEELELLMQKSDSIATEDCSEVTGFTNLDNNMNQIEQQLKAWNTPQTIAKNEE